MKPKFSKSGATIVIALAVFVVVMLAIDNVPKLFKKGKKPPAPAVQNLSKPQPRPPAEAPAKVSQPAPPPKQNAGIETAKRLLPDFELLRERLGRDDPFAPLYPVEAEAAELPDDMLKLPMLPPMAVKNPPGQHLSATAMRDGRGIAIINGEIVREGDFIDRFVVDQIKEREVTLSSGTGEQIVLTIRQIDLPDFSVSGGVISNIPAEAKELLIREDGFIDVSPESIGGATSTAPAEPSGE
ncbi:MAG: hypothetical protein ABIH66_04480 [bacterium]